MKTSRDARRRVATMVTVAFLALAAPALALPAAGCGSSGGGDAAVTEQQVIDLVDLTCAAIENDAPGTFAAIDAGEAPYVDPENPALYAFVFDRDVKIVADPDPAFQGRDMKGVPDAAGKLFRDALVSGAFADGSGWIEYVKAKPGEDGLYSKASYYKLVTGSDGVQYVVGAGRYLGPWEGTPSPSPSTAAAPPTRAAVKAFVDEALACARKVGKEKAIAAFMDTSGPFYRDGLYIFAYDMNGVVLCLPAEPDKVGDDRWDAQDPAGAYFVRELVRVAEGPGQGWVQYEYINPAQGDELQSKTSYVRRVDDTWLLGAGTYAPVRVTKAQVVDFVERAAAYVEANGKEKALAAFNDPQGGFRAGDLYIFAKDFDGHELANGGNPKLVGANLKESDDPHYRQVFDLLYAAAVKGAGWTAYTWPNPGAGEDQTKRTYVVKAGEDWFLGAGQYVGPATRVTAERVVAFVEGAAAYVKVNGKKKALEVFSDPQGEFRDGELYVFAEDFKGNELASGGQPELVGQNILDAQDASGVYLVKELIATARDKGSGWVSYVWENPETGEQQAKRAY
ncbi:MAG: cache domain-containing protein, partial [Actinomycetes bacterium]